MLPKLLSAEYFDGWYADKAAMPAVAEIMNRHTGFPAGTRAGVVPAEAIPELVGELRLRPGSTLLDLACGRGAYGLLVAKQAGTSLIGVDFSAQALAEAQEQVARLGVSNASFHVGELTATGLPDASVEAVLCTDAIQFPGEPAVAYEEIRRILKPGGRVALTCWEPFDRADERLTPAEAFGIYLPMLTEWRRLPYRDPGIPLSLLPQDWDGVAAGELFGELNAALGSPARDHALRVIRATAR